MQAMNLPNIQFELQRTDLKLALIGLDEVRIAPSLDGWRSYEESIFEKIRQTTSLEDLKDDDIFRSYRDLYWSFGMDPTKLRVSSEALVRRIVNGFNLWSISNLVDVVNLSSASHKIPIGLVDASKVKGTLRIRIALQNEIFIRIGGEQRECKGGEIVLSDDEQIVCFGFATHDSERTKVADASKTVHVILYGSPELSMDYFETATYNTLVMLKKWVNCTALGVAYFQCSG